MDRPETKLIVLRGPSGSGKSSIAKMVRLAQQEKMALIEQDHFRRIVLKEKDVPNGLNAELIKQTIFFALEHSYHVLLEGIFYTENYGRMFEEILSAHPNNNYFFTLIFPSKKRCVAISTNLIKMILEKKKCELGTNQKTF